MAALLTLANLQQKEISLTRVRLLKVIYYLIFLVIAVRLFYWQVIRFDDLSALADQQHLASYSLDAPRGIITSADGAILAANRPSFVLFGLPKIIDQPKIISAEVARIITANRFHDENPDIQVGIKNGLEESLMSKLTQDLQWTILDRNIDLNLKQELEKLNLKGIGFENQLVRFYPEASSAAHLLGFVGSNSSGQPTGYFGIEGYYNRELTGVGGEVVEEKDAQGIPIAIGKYSKKDAKSGRNLILNINRTVQYIVEKKLKEGMEKYGAKSGMVIVMEPKSGAVLAMASFPGYDPNSFENYPRDNFKNPAVADAYEPGSTFKALVMAAALNEGVVSPDTKCDICDGPIESAGYLIRTWNNKYYPDTNMTDVIVHSDNTGMVFIGRKLGVDKMYEYIQKFGFGTLTQVDLQDESTPDIRHKNEWSDIDLATASFGQGIAVTPFQLIRAITAIANDGYLMEPHVVKAVQIGDTWKEIKPKVLSQPIDAVTAETVTKMMVEAVSRGEAKAFVPKGFEIAGKTGTAQIPVAGHYDPNKTIASFVGFAPAQDPKFVMLVRYGEPSSSIFGSETAAPTFFAIAKELLTYFNVPPQM